MGTPASISVQLPLCRTRLTVTGMPGRKGSRCQTSVRLHGRKHRRKGASEARAAAHRHWRGGGGGEQRRPSIRPHIAHLYRLSVTLTKLRGLGKVWVAR